MIQGFLPSLGSSYEDFQIFNNFKLSSKIIEAQWPQRLFDILVGGTKVLAITIQVIFSHNSIMYLYKDRKINEGK